jgi:hypothetical protein
MKQSVSKLGNIYELPQAGMTEHALTALNNTFIESQLISALQSGEKQKKNPLIWEVEDIEVHSLMLYKQ